MTDRYFPRAKGTASRHGDFSTGASGLRLMAVRARNFRRSSGTQASTRQRTSSWVFASGRSAFSASRTLSA
eukprot:5248921-Alexandrium_andersonii.AAC.1